MRYIIVAVLLSLATNDGQAANSLTWFKSDLEYFSGDSLLEPESGIMLKQMPRLQRLLHEADSLCRVNRYQVDLIGQWHWSENPIPYELKQIRISQKQVDHLLDSLRYDVIGTEGGMFTGRITPQSYRTHIEDEERRRSFFVSYRQIDERLEFIRKYDGVIKYLWRRPKSYVISADDPVVWQLGVRYYQASEETPRQFQDSLGPTWKNLMVSLRIARTEIALALLIVELHKTGNRRGAVVLGCAHADEWPEITARYGVQTTYYPSIDLSKGQIQELRRILTQTKKQ